MTVKIRKGDTVEIVAGKDKTARGRVLEVIPRKRKIIIEGVGRVTRHEKIRMSRRGSQEGGIQHKEAAIDISNVALVCPNDGPTRVGYRVEPGKGGKVRICKKCGAEI
jgi:large subunit ribosomal protein L24